MDAAHVEIHRAADAGGTTARRSALVAGTLITLLVLVLNVPGNSLLDVRRHQAPGFILSHLGLLLLAWGWLPGARAALRELAAASAGRRATLLAFLVVLPGWAMALLSAAAPSYAHQLLTREWGLVEPLQCMLYLGAAWLCHEIARLPPEDSERARLYRAGRWIGLLLALEEVEYFDVFAWIAGGRRPRIATTNVGSLHDLPNLVYEHAGMAGAIAVLVGLVALAWLALVRYRAAMREELSSRASLLLPLVLLFLGWSQLVDVMGFAHLVDLDPDSFLASPAWGRSITNLSEEPIELLGAVMLDVFLVQRFAAHHGAARRN